MGRYVKRTEVYTGEWGFWILVFRFWIVVAEAEEKAKEREKR